MTTEPHTLADLGWSNHESMQLDPEAPDSLIPARISQVHRSVLTALSAAGTLTLSTPPGAPTSDFAVGDWVIADPATKQLVHRLERRSLLQRRAAGTDARTQLIAANIDTLFIVSSCNPEFNEARIERYIVLAEESGVRPVLLLTKADLSNDPAAYVARANVLSPRLPVILLDAHAPDDLEKLFDWWKQGQTAALLGSSGVGKSTLLNGLANTDSRTQGMREDDAKGRHTTTHRSLHRVRHGGWLIDTPGMRALRLHSASEGIENVFADLSDLAQTCRFADCAHETEPDCAIQSALKDGSLDPVRFQRWQKLQQEEKRNSASISQARTRDKNPGKPTRKPHNQPRHKKR